MIDYYSIIAPCYLPQYDFGSVEPQLQNEKCMIEHIMIPSSNCYLTMSKGIIGLATLATLLKNRWYKMTFETA